MPDLPPITQLIPHRPPMLLVDEVVHHEGATVVCRTTIGDDRPFVQEDGTVPALLAIELFAQSAAALISLRATGGTRSLSSGALLGSRRIDLHAEGLRVGDVLEIRCEERYAIGMAAQIQCQLRRGDALLAEGSVNVMAGDPEAADRTGAGP